MSDNYIDEELSSAERLVRIEEASNEDGSVEVEILGWEEEDGVVTVEMITPVGDVETEEMPFPEPGHDLTEYKFYRMLQEADLSIRNAELLQGEVFDAAVISEDYKTERWEIQLDKSSSITDRIADTDVNWLSLTISAVYLAMVVISLLALVVALL